jgi:hypothetical protein
LSPTPVNGNGTIAGANRADFDRAGVEVEPADVLAAGSTPGRRGTTISAHSALCSSGFAASRGGVL